MNRYIQYLVLISSACDIDTLSEIAQETMDHPELTKYQKDVIERFINRKEHQLRGFMNET